MDKSYSSIALTMALALLTPASARAQDAPAEDAATAPEPAVAEHIRGTVLQVELQGIRPATSEERGVLRVAGPRGYTLTKRFEPGAPIAVDLLAEAEHRRAGADAAPAQRSDLEAASRRAPWNALPDGGYVYEVVLTDSAGGSRAHVGRFRVENGAAIPRVRRRFEPASASGTSASDGRLSEKAFTEADFIKIDDGGNDGTTFLTLDSDDGSDNPHETWGLFNRFGDFTIEECGDGSNLGSCQRPLLTLLDDESSLRRVGIGTAAPADVDLHIVSTEGRILLEDTGESAWMIEEFGGGLDFFLFSPSPFRPDDSVGTKLFISGSGNVGIGRIGPLAKLHVAGDAIVEGDVALGSSRTIKHAVEPLEPSAVLAAIRELPLYSWRYRADPVQALHVGPMAEDVHAAFHLGRDDEHLSPGDSAGLALAAIQGVDSELQRMRDQLARRLAELEQLVAAALLAQAQGTAEPDACD